jgi:hypothetical protein
VKRFSVTQTEPPTSTPLNSGLLKNKCSNSNSPQLLKTVKLSRQHQRERAPRRAINLVDGCIVQNSIFNANRESQNATASPKGLNHLYQTYVPKGITSKASRNIIQFAASQLEKVAVKPPANPENWKSRAQNIRDKVDITPEEEREFLNLINEAVGNKLGGLHLPIKSFWENERKWKVGHVYFDKNFFKAVGEILTICHAGVGKEISVRRRSCLKKNVLGYAIRVGPKIIQDTPAYTKSVVQHEYTHLLLEKFPSEGAEGEANSEVLSTAEQFQYIHFLSKDEIYSITAYYLRYYSSASSRWQSQSLKNIRAYITNKLPLDPNSVNDILRALNRIERSDFLNTPHDSRKAWEEIRRACLVVRGQQALEAMQK